MSDGGGDGDGAAQEEPDAPEPPPAPLPLTEAEPLPIRTSAHTFDVQFHPREPVVATATIEGCVELYRFDRAANASELVQTLRCHADSCRTARFLPEGGPSASSRSQAAALRIASTAADKLAVVTDVEAGTRLWKQRMTGKGNALLPLSAERFAVGDEDGGLRVFDTRQQKAVVRWSENSDFISDLALGSDGLSLCATSGDGTLAVYDIRKAGVKGLIAMSDFQEDEFLACCVMRNGSRVVCGSQTGNLAVFTWGDFGDMKERIRGHPMSVDAMVKVDEDAILTGSSDGRIRAVSIFGKEFGNAVLGMVAEHGEYPVERVALSPCGELFASASHEQPAVRVWSMELARRLFANGSAADDAGAAAAEAEVDSDDSDEPRGKKPKQRKKRRKVTAGNDTQRKAAGFFADL